MYVAKWETVRNNNDEPTVAMMTTFLDEQASKFGWSNNWNKESHDIDMPLINVILDYFFINVIATKKWTDRIIDQNHVAVIVVLLVTADIVTLLVR